MLQVHSTVAARNVPLNNRRRAGGLASSRLRYIEEEKVLFDLFIPEFWYFTKN